VQECSSTLVVTNATAEIERACLWLEDFAAEAGINPDATSRLQLVLDEVLSNIVTHAGLPAGEHSVALAVRRLGGHIELEVIDDGPAFDPTGRDAEDRAESDAEDRAERIRERRPGGVGLLFIRRLMDEVRFSRQDAHNRLTLALRLPPDEP
jgi:anti-sigma regulatory factor (Ser/Thr protein kinase)